MYLVCFDWDLKTQIKKILIVNVFDDTQHFAGIRSKFKDWKNENLETDIMTKYRVLSQISDISLSTC